MRAPAKSKAPAVKRRLGDCAPGDVAHTPAGHLLVTGKINDTWPFVRLWHPYEQREVSHPFGAPPDLAVLDVTRKPMPVAAGKTYDPVRG